MKPDKPLKMYVYQPLSVKGEHIKTKLTHFPFFHVEIGDVFTNERRTEKPMESKVAAVRFNLFERGCMVTLEDMEFETIEELNRYVNGMRK